MKAIIFDMDGVISDTVGLHLKIQTQILKKHKIYTKSIFSLAGIKVNDIFKKAAKEKKVNISENKINELVEEYWHTLSKKISSIKPMLGAKELIVKLKDNGFRLAVASSSNKKFVHSVLNHFKVRSFFEVIITGDQVKKGKPNPDIFILAAKRLSANPEDCIVIEDSINGMVAAKKAGMKCIGITKNKCVDDCPCSIQVDAPKRIDIDELNKIL